MSYKKITKETVAHNKVVGQRIKTFRLLKKISQAALGKMLAFTSSGTISMIESGKRGVDVMTLGKIAAALDTYPEILSEQTELTKEELIHLNQLLHILKDPRNPKRKDLLSLLKSR